MSDFLRLTVLIENEKSGNMSLACEHGLSVYIESEQGNFLFDTGQSNRVIHNADQLNINLAKIKGIILSHGHYDHTGGLFSVLERIEKKVPMFRGPGFYADRYRKLDRGACKYIGNPFRQQEIQKKPVVDTTVSDTLEIAEGLYLFRSPQTELDFEPLRKEFLTGRHDSSNKPGSTSPCKENFQLDAFEDEISLLAKTKRGPVVLSGCSHRGIINIVQEAKRKFGPLYGAVGGMHLKDANDHRIVETMEHFEKEDIRFIVPMHCTGAHAEAMMKKRFLSKCHLLHTGDTYSF